MPVTTTVSKDNKSIRIAVTGSFDYSLQGEFRNAYRHASESGVEFRVNLSGTNFMDSSALGMLILIQEHAQACNGRVVIEAPSEGVKRVLMNAKFDRLLTIEGC